MNEFYQYYNDTIKQNLKKLESERLAQYKTYKILKFCQLLILVVLIIFFIAFIFGFMKFTYFLLSICIGSGILILFHKQKNSVVETYKTKIRVPIIRKIASKWMGETAQSKLGILSENYMRIASGVNRKEAGINFYNRRGLKGTFNEKPIEFYFAEKVVASNSQINDKLGQSGNFLKGFIEYLFKKIDSSIDSKKKEYFLMTSFPLTKNIGGRIFALPKYTTYTIGKYYSNIAIVTTDNDELNGLYDIYTDNPASVRIVEEINFFSKILESKTNYFGRLAFIIDNGLCYVILKTAYDICNFQIYEETDNGGKFNDISQILEFLFKLITGIEKSLK